MTPPTDTIAHRTDPRSFAVSAVGMLARVVVPLLVGAVAIVGKSGAMLAALYILPGLLVLIGANVLIAYLVWSRLTYTVGLSDIRVESGVLARSARSVPFDRIQDVSLEQKLLPRLFGLVAVKFETGAGAGDDLTLTYLTEAEGERLREVIRTRRDAAPAEPAEADADTPITQAPGRLLFAMPPRRVLTFGLFEFSLAIVAVCAGLAQQLDFLLPFEIWDWKAWRSQLSGSGRWLADLGLAAQLIGGVLALGSLALIGIATGVVRTALREWDFRLERTDKGFRRRRGLLTRTDLVMPVHRVQALRIETKLVRRLFGWHALKLVSLASDSGSANHEAVPFGQLAEIAPVAGETGFALPGDDLAWHRSAPAFRVDELAVNLVLMAVLAIVAVVAGRSTLALLPVAGAVLLAAHSGLRWLCDRHAFDARQLYIRHGWLAPRLAIASRERLQSVEIRRHPLARWRGYADVVFGLAGGKLQMRGVQLADAEAIRAAVLESMSRADFSELIEEPRKRA